MTREVESFLTPKLSENSWDFLAEQEKAVWGKAVTSIIAQEGPRAGIWGGGRSAVGPGFNHPAVTDIMYSNLNG